MKRTTLSLPEDLAHVLAREARLRGVSISAVVRDALSAHYHLDGSPRQVSFAKLGRSDGKLAAADMDEYLAEHWADDIEEDAFGGRRS